MWEWFDKSWWSCPDLRAPSSVADFCILENFFPLNHSQINSLEDVLSSHGFAYVPEIHSISPILNFNGAAKHLRHIRVSLTRIHLSTLSKVFEKNSGHLGLTDVMQSKMLDNSDAPMQLHVVGEITSWRGVPIFDANAFPLDYKYRPLPMVPLRIIVKKFVCNYRRSFPSRLPMTVTKGTWGLNVAWISYLPLFNSSTGCFWR